MTYSGFWLCYVRAHDRAGTRLTHYLGSGTALVLLIIAPLTQHWWLVLLAVMVGYGLAWPNQFLIERNRPATFGHAFWSLISDVRMLTLWATGRLAPHLKQARGIWRNGWWRELDSIC
jgi:hypothetical protein